ncbi:hypothetical protein [Sphingomonas sp.]|uniref:hypothetical protein n=1 Tax=Sphingomonas sp. TaxID=28214 RepID=UPI001EBD5510|nr:hypothetical protein [Sphingomonas sp.]MBX3595721.1 hypothetical protein [Sphingomonas sp.]
MATPKSTPNARPRKTAKTAPEPMVSTTARKAAQSAGRVLRDNAIPIAGAVAAGAAAAAALFFTRHDADAPADGHPAPDLETATHPGADDRAPPHFRPDMDSALKAGDRAALEPALAGVRPEQTPMDRLGG